jgi:hypothetical protein
MHPQLLLISFSGYGFVFISAMCNEAQAILNKDDTFFNIIKFVSVLSQFFVLIVLVKAKVISL